MPDETIWCAHSLIFQGVHSILSIVLRVLQNDRLGDGTNGAINKSNNSGPMVRIFSASSKIQPLPLFEFKNF
jgi:hypothetical protein